MAIEFPIWARPLCGKATSFGLGHFAEQADIVAKIFTVTRKLVTTTIFLILLRLASRSGRRDIYHHTTRQIHCVSITEV